MKIEAQKSGFSYSKYHMNTHILAGMQEFIELETEESSS